MQSSEQLLEKAGEEGYRYTDIAERNVEKGTDTQSLAEEMYREVKIHSI